jgi:HPr kinase/phosphorylase
MGAPHYTVALQKIAAEQGLTVLHAAQDYATREIRTADVNRPGLQLAGFYNYFDPERMQIIGRVESTYLETLTPDQRRERFEQFMRYNIIGLVICHGMDPFPECLEMAEKYDRNLFLVRKDTSEFMADLIAALSSYLAPRLTQHGVLVEVFGEGVLITGDSGVGKSETALELIKRGHRLVADDAVEIKRIRARDDPLLHGAARHRRDRRAADLRRRRRQARDARGSRRAARAVGGRPGL